MNNITIDKEKCTGCGLCKTDCGLHIKGRIADDSIHVDPDHPRCDGCLHCYVLCPAGAITPAGIKANGKGPDIQGDFLLDLFTSRRSVRQFKDESLSEYTIKALVTAASQIPSGGNRHPVKCTILTKSCTRDDLVEELKKYYRRVLGIMNNPVLRRILAFFAPGEMKSFLTSPEYRTRLKELLSMLAHGKDPLFYNAPAVFLFHSDVPIPTPKEDSVLAAYNTALRAASLDYGSCFVSLAQKVINKREKCKTVLGLSKNTTIHSILVVGKPALNHRRSVVRQTIPFEVR